MYLNLTDISVQFTAFFVNVTDLLMSITEMPVKFIE